MRCVDVNRKVVMLYLNNFHADETPIGADSDPSGNVLTEEMVRIRKGERK